jgi:hypothetical protein
MGKATFSPASRRVEDGQGGVLHPEHVSKFQEWDEGIYLGQVRDRQRGVGSEGEV